MEETTICRICFEPIMNFLCVECLNQSISKWLLLENSELLADYQKFHLLLSIFFSSDEQEFCVKCKKKSSTILCPYCYTSEVFLWLLEKNTKTAKKFAYLFNFDFFGSGLFPHTKARNLNGIIISEDKENFDEIGVCENCGQTSENLKKKNGIWLCESCREED
ncbi:MAG: hypothetical protein QW412_01455 [Candidatus Aenigmatarchaeota archaeon]